jgi:hypothetical protein
MQTLGLASEEKPSDGMFKRLFWPTIGNQYDVDLVGQQGFWLCTIVAVLSLVMSTLGHQPLIGLLLAVTYFIGGTGVRERSIAAAVLVFLCFLMDRIVTFETMLSGILLTGPVVGLIALMLLFANVRATVLSRRWASGRTPEDIRELPERSTTSFPDKMANVLPPALWPTGQYLFYPLVTIVLLLSLLAAIAIPIMRQKQARPAPAQQAPSTMIHVSPSR